MNVKQQKCFVTTKNREHRDFGSLRKNDSWCEVRICFGMANALILHYTYQLVNDITYN